MSNLDILTALDDAIRIIAKIRKSELSGGATAIWSKLDHAENHLNKQISEALKPEVEAANA